jgi:predicted ABC-type ATPase
MSCPVLTIIAGSNGCGKNTLVAAAREKFQHAPVIDREAFAKTIQETLASEDPDSEAGKRVVRLSENLIAGRHSFTVVTTLSGGTYLHIASRAKHLGYKIMVIFVGTASVDINIERLKGRVKKGGAAIPESDLRRRFPLTLSNMQRMLPESDWAIIFDNSGEGGHTVVGVGENGRIRWKEPVPEWTAFLRKG